MAFDLDHRFTRAVNPEGLATIANALDALIEAVSDARNAGASPESDPAVRLLARHLGRIADGDDILVVRDKDMALRGQCFGQISDLKQSPMLVTLARRGVGYNEHLKKIFHQEAKKALRALAAELGLVTGQFEVRSNMAGIAVSGEITLHADNVYIQITACGFMVDGEIMYRSCASRDDYKGDRNHFADISQILRPGQFAQKIMRDLNLAVPAKTQHALAI